MFSKLDEGFTIGNIPGSSSQFSSPIAQREKLSEVLLSEI